MLLYIKAVHTFICIKYDLHVYFVGYVYIIYATSACSEKKIIALSYGRLFDWRNGDRIFKNLSTQLVGQSNMFSKFDISQFDNFIKSISMLFYLVTVFIKLIVLFPQEKKNNNLEIKKPTNMIKQHVVIVYNYTFLQAVI